MGVRDLVNRYRYPALATSATVLLVAAVFGYQQVRSGGRPALPVIAQRAFYSTDDGATLFADNIDRIVPFDHDGQPAARAHVFVCATGGHRWVQYLEKLSDEGAKQMAIFWSSPPGTAASPTNESWLVKKPGPSVWVRRSDPAAMEISRPQCPEGCDPASIREMDPD